MELLLCVLRLQDCVVFVEVAIVVAPVVAVAVAVVVMGAVNAADFCEMKGEG